MQNADDNDNSVTPMEVTPTVAADAPSISSDDNINDSKPTLEISSQSYSKTPGQPLVDFVNQLEDYNPTVFNHNDINIF